MARTYDIGDVVRISSTFTQSAVVVDPATVSLSVKAPDGTVAPYTYAAATVIKDAAGEYHVDIAPVQTGTYRYRWSSTGTAAAAEESWFQVRSRRVP